MVSDLVLVGAGALALTYGVIWADAEPSWPRSLCKTLSVALLALASALMGAPALITAGLALGALGDLFLSRSGQAAFLGGMAAFGLGHLAYTAVFWCAGADLSLFWIVGLGALAASTEFWLAPHTGALRWPVRAYVVIIVLMALAASTLGMGLAAAGAALFLLSDLLLSLDLFVLAQNATPRPALRRTLWAAYWGGQALILLGMVPPAAA